MLKSRAHLLITTCFCLVPIVGCTPETGTNNGDQLDNAGGVYINQAASLSPYLADYEYDEPLSQSHLNEQLSKQWSFSIDVSSADVGDPFSVSSCEDYFRANGAEPVKPSEYPVYNALGKRCLAAQWIVNMTPAEQSGVENISMDRALVDSLPKELAFMVSETERQRLMEDQSIETWADALEVEHIESPAPSELTVHLPAARQELVLLARGDLNGDGVDDFLLKVKNYSLEGTYSAVNLFVVTRLLPMRILKWFATHDNRCAEVVT